MTSKNWDKIVYVKEAPLTLDAIVLRHKRTDKILDNKYTMQGQSYLYLDGDIYYHSKTEVQNYRKLIRRHARDLNKLFKTIYIVADRFAWQESRFEPKILARKSNAQLISILDEYCLNYQNALSTLYIPLAMDEVLTEKIKNYIAQKFPEKINELYNSVTPLLKKHDVTKYHEGLLKIALNRKQQAQKLTKLSKKYAFLGIKFYLGRPFNAKTSAKHLKHIQNPVLEIKQKIANKQKESKDLKKAMKLLKPPVLIKKQIAWLQEAIFMRTYRLERLSEGENNSFVLLSEIGKRLSVDKFDLIYFRFVEIIAALRGEYKVTKQEITRRKKPFGLFDLRDQIVFYFGKDYLKFKRRFKFDFGGNKEVKGQVAFPGLVRGKVRLIRIDEEMHKIKKGEILVTRMTTPDYIFAMKISSAVVTDIGSVTSHASVVSRELGKPCVIGTVNATQVFKTGDLVEVDANQGIVRKIK